MTNVHSVNTYQEELLTKISPEDRNKAAFKDNVFTKSLSLSQSDMKTKEEIISDVYSGGGLVFLGFLGLLLYIEGADFLAVLHLAVTFLICLFIPFIAVFDAPVFLLFIAGFGFAFIFVVKKCPAKIRSILFTLLFAGWIFIGYQAMHLSFYGSFSFPYF